MQDFVIIVTRKFDSTFDSAFDSAKFQFITAEGSSSKGLSLDAREYK